MKKKTKEEKELDRLAKEELEAEKDLQEKPLEFLLSFLEKDEEEVEFEKFYAERYPEEVAQEKAENKRLIRTAIIAFVTVVVLGVTGILIFNEIFKPYLLKYTKPYMENYYLEKYGQEAKISNIEYVKAYSEEDRKFHDTNIALATLDNGNHIMCIENANIGDDISITNTINDYTQDVKGNFGDAGIVTNNPKLSYQDYYVDYSIFYKYIGVLPDNKTYADLKYDNRKLSINDVWIYQNYLDVNRVQQFLTSFNENSIIYAIKQEAGLPVEVYRITSNGVLYFPVITSVKVTKDVTSYLFDTNYSDVTKVNVLNVNSKSIDSTQGYRYYNSYLIKYEKKRRKREEGERPKYYLLKFSNRSLSSTDFTPLNSRSTGKGKYSEYTREFPEIGYIGFTDNVYVIANTNKLVFANYSVDDSFLCSLNLC